MLQPRRCQTLANPVQQRERHAHQRRRDTRLLIGIAFHYSSILDLRKHWLASLVRHHAEIALSTMEPHEQAGEASLRRPHRNAAEDQRPDIPRPNHRDAPVIEENLLAARFRDEFGYRWAFPTSIHDAAGGGRTMYHMIHATDHPEASPLMLRAYRKAARRRD